SARPRPTGAGCASRSSGLSSSTESPPSWPSSRITVVSLPMAEDWRDVAVRIGPTWWPDPDRTLYVQVAAWCRRWLRQPDGPDAGRPLELTDQQKHILALWYAFDDDGRWLFRRGTIRMCK